MSRKFICDGPTQRMRNEAEERTAARQIEAKMGGEGCGERHRVTGGMRCFGDALTPEIVEICVLNCRIYKCQIYIEIHTLHTRV